MKNKVSKTVFRRVALPLITLTFLSSSALGVAEAAVNGDVSTQMPSQQVITKGAGVSTVKQKTGRSGEILRKQESPQKVSQGTAFSGVKSLIGRFENWTNKVVSTVKTVILPKPGTKTQSVTVKKQSSSVGSTPSTSLPQVPVVKKEAVQPIETEKQLPKIRPQGVALPIEEPTSKDVEAIASLLVSKPVVNEIIEGEVPPSPPLPKLRIFTPVPSVAEVQSASDAIDELATAVKETAKIKDEIGDTQQAIAKLTVQKQVLVEESLQAAEKQNVLLSNLKAQRTEPISRESFLESIRNSHVLRNVSTQPKQEIVSQPETLLDNLKQSLAVRRVAIAEEKEGEDVQELSSAVESAILLTPLKKTVDEVIIDNLAAIEAVQMKIAALKPTAEVPLETGFTKQAQQQNRARSQATKEIEKLNGEINVYHKNNALLMAQKTTQQEEIASKQQKVLSKLKTKQAEPQGESLLESIRKQTILKKTNNPPEETSGNTAKIQQKPGGVMKSLEQKMEEFKQKLPIASHHTHDEDDEWE